MERYTVKKLVRLDLQGQFPSNGIQCANLQIQLNAQSEADGLVDSYGYGQTRTTIALVLMPSDKVIPIAIMKEAFSGSLKDSMTAIIFKLP